MRIYFLLLLSIVLNFSCEHQVQEDTTKMASLQAEGKNEVSQSVFKNTSNQLDKYWYQGKAELNTYDLEQNRYQDVNPGEALLVFVTEDFLTDLQVKNDRNTNPNSISVLKTNAIYRFTTGIYDYSMMTSVFTPVKTSEQARTLKVTNSSQDWCGQTYSQVNWTDNAYRQILHSYFENEADAVANATADLLEDEIFNRIRMGPAHLPTGALSVIPSMNFLRLKHQNYQAYPAEASRAAYQGDTFTGESLQSYVLDFPRWNRKLEIVFEGESPYTIVGWQDTYPSVFDQQPRSTIARLRTTRLESYWEQNANNEANRVRREVLQWGQ